MLFFLRNILQLVLSATRGWEDIAASTNDPQRLVTRCVFPLLGFSSLTVFFKLVYDTGLYVVDLLVHGLVTFVAYFVTFYFALIMFKSYFHYFSDPEPDQRRFTTFIAYGVSLLAICNIIYNVLPKGMSLGLLYLLPLAVTLILWKANNFLRVRSDMDVWYIIFVLGTIILPPALISNIF